MAKSPTGKKSAPRTAGSKKPAPRRAGSAAGRTAASKPTRPQKPKKPKKPGRSGAAAKSRSLSATSPRRASLGRPLVTLDEKLFMLFHDDFHARQIFTFLNAETVGDLEQFSPQEIVKRLSQPIQETVRRIRERLAGKNRCLKDDLEFAASYLAAQRGK